MSHYGNEVPFEVPEGWVWCRLGDIAYVAAGSTPSKECFVEHGIPYIKMYNLRNQKIDFDFHPQYIDYKTHTESLHRSMTQVGDIIMNIVGPPLGKLAIIPNDLPEANFNQAAVLIRPLLYKNTLNKYIFRYLEQMSEINSISTKGSAGQVNISLSQSQSIRVPLPSLNEQKRIVEEIDRCFTLLDTLEQNECDLKEAIQKSKSKILDLALSGHLTSDTSHYPQLPDGWKEVRLGDICRLISGTSYSKNDVKPDGIRILRGGNIQYGKVLLLDNDVYISTSLRNKECSLMKGDIIIVASTGSFDLIGKAGYIEQDISNAQIGAFLRIVRPIDSSISQYLRLIFESTLYRSHIQDLAKGTNINNIKASYITDFCIPLPPMGERKKICNIVKIISQQIDDIESSMLK